MKQKSRQREIFTFRLHSFVARARRRHLDAHQFAADNAGQTSSYRKTMISVLIGSKQERGRVFRCLFTVRAPRVLRGDRRAPVGNNSQQGNQVPVDNISLRRLDCRVAKAITGFCVKRNHTGGSFPPNVRASSPLASPQAVPTEWPGRKLTRLTPWFSAFRHSKVSNRVLSTSWPK